MKNQVEELPMTAGEKSVLNHNYEKTKPIPMFVLIATIVFEVFIYVGMDGWALPMIVVGSVFGGLLIAVLVRMNMQKREIAMGIKKRMTGTLKKKNLYSSRKTGIKYRIKVDTQNFIVTSRIYEKVQKGDVVAVDYAPYTKDVIHVQVLNPVASL